MTLASLALYGEWISKTARVFFIACALLLPQLSHASAVVNSSQCQTQANKQNPFMLVLQRGENIHQAILQCVTQAKLDNAAIRGIGAIENPTLAYFDLKKKQYLNQKFYGIYELLALNGDVSLDKGHKMLHLHTVIGTRKFTTLGGHLMDGSIGVTGEIMITPLTGQAVRSLNTATGLNLIDTKNLTNHPQAGIK